MCLRYSNLLWLLNLRLELSESRPTAKLSSGRHAPGQEVPTNPHRLGPASDECREPSKGGLHSSHEAAGPLTPRKLETTPDLAKPPRASKRGEGGHGDHRGTSSPPGHFSSSSPSSPSLTVLPSALTRYSTLLWSFRVRMS